MTDLSTTIAPNSTQTNADDLLAGPRTIRITKVVKRDSKEQPIDIYFEGDDNKPYKPCKSMRRVLVEVWSKDGASYVGKAMTIFREPTVLFGGDRVGGIRISHLSDIGDKPVTVILTMSRGVRKPYTVQPLKSESAKKERAPKSIEDRIAAFRSALAECANEAAVSALVGKASALFTDLDDATVVKLRDECAARKSALSGQEAK